ncbi:MAG: DNA gyrase inhibitor YacG [Paracoccus sp. (in: a-proteobacteria)]|uniref:DNA gyrase inhibitor YacG n=1 Tax=Paracoccus sp. TaxID=267 RepID=UPI00391B68E5
MAACPICAKPSVQQYRPFCSKRCADVDLAKWLRGDYVIPGAPLEDLPSTEPDDEARQRG